MIRTIDIRPNAAHPELPLPEATTYQGAPSTAFLRGVPKACGQWQITAVSVAVTFPDNSTTTRAAVLSAGDVWVVTIPACATSGRTVSGLRILADGTDENGDAVTGYVLGVADLAVATFDIAPAPGVTSYALRYFDNVPNPPHKGDVVKVDNVLKFYNGTAWEPFAAPVTFDNTVTKTSTNGVKSSGIWSAIWGTLAALPTGFTSLYDWCVSQLAGKATKADATLTERGYTAWEVTPATFQGLPIEIRWVDATQYGYPGYSWEPFAGSQMLGGAYNDNENATTFYCESTIAEVGGPITATRTALQGYELGNQSSMPLASEAEAEALRAAVAAKYAKPSGGIPKSDLASGVQTSLDKADNALPKSGGTMSGNINLNNSLLNFGNAEHGVEATGGTNIDEVNFRCKDTNKTVILKIGNGGTLAFTADLPYDLGTPTVISTASSEVVEGETVYYGAATLADRTANIVQVTAAMALDELRITFPAATSGKVRDFGLRVEIGTGSAALAAPALVPVAPSGETIQIENNAAEIPALADGTATAKGVTLLYFSETAPGVFVVKGEQVEEVA